MKKQRDFQISLLDGAGSLMQTILVPAESVADAFNRAQDIAIAMQAADFYIKAPPRESVPPRAARAPLRTVSRSFAALLTLKSRLSEHRP